VKRLAPTPLAPRRRMTALTFCKLLVKTIEGEPKRLDMGDWLFAYRDTNGLMESGFLSERQPECGTIACLGGWGRLLATGRHRPKDVPLAYPKGAYK
jgi:hypothetical protein